MHRIRNPVRRLLLSGLPAQVGGDIVKRVIESISFTDKRIRAALTYVNSGSLQFTRTLFLERCNDPRVNSRAELPETPAGERPSTDNLRVLLERGHEGGGAKGCSRAAVVANAICLPLGALIALVFLPVGQLDWKPGWIFIAFLVSASQCKQQCRLPRRRSAPSAAFLGVVRAGSKQAVWDQSSGIGRS